MKKPLIFGFIITLMLFCSCDPDKKVRKNPLVDAWADNFGLPPFHKIVAADYEPAIEYAIKTHLAEIDEIVAAKELPEFDNVILPLDSSGRRLHLVWDLFTLAASVNAGGEMDSLNMLLAARMAAHDDAIFHNRALFDKVKAVYDARFSLGIDSLQLRLTEKSYMNFVRAGAALSEVDKESLRKINQELAKSEVLYGIHFVDDRNRNIVVTDSSNTDGLTYAVKSYASTQAKERGLGGRFALTMEDYIVNGVLSMSSKGRLREEYIDVYEKLGSGDSLNGKLVWDIVHLRNEKARLLGYETYAAYSTPGRMAGSTGAVYDMLDRVWNMSVSKVQADGEAVSPVRPSAATGQIKKWDWDYYLAQLRKRETTVDQEQIEQYMTLVNVRLSAFELCNRLFGLTFRPVPADLYDDDCEAFEVFNADNSHLGVMIFDYYSDPDKRSGAWTHCIRARWPYGGDYSNPVTCSVFNFAKPANESRPTLLSFGNVEEMFRQVGNAVEIMLADTPYAGLQRLEPDMAGVTGEMLSYWAFESQMMFNYATYYSSEKQLADVNLERISSSRNFRRSYDVTRMVASAYLDMDIHMNAVADTIVAKEGAFEREYLRVRHGMPHNIGLQNSLANFTPVFASSDGAGYYGKLWAGVLGADVFDLFKRGTNLFDRGVATRFREQVLAKGSGAPADSLYRNFRGRDLSPLSFLVYNGFEDKSLLKDNDTEQIVPAEVQPGDTIPAPVPALELWKSSRLPDNTPHTPSAESI